ncbi:MAG: DUF4062 domain-containing protein [Candidatus Marinimicrobia bacterium]|nr:DUF4062 domain-containing protein [Candidatus Neomarinimicrobiota bacterium]
MKKIKIFISSVQNEFAHERATLMEYIHSDPMLGIFFDVFIFENLPAFDISARDIYLKEVKSCDIYLGLLGKDYGYEDNEGISPTEREFDYATKLYKTRIIYLTSHLSTQRHEKEQRLVEKAQSAIVRKQFISIHDLKSAVYASLVKYLLEKEIIRTAPFDASYNEKAVIADIDPDKTKWFIRLARSKRGLPLSEEASITELLTHLNLMENNRIRNAALLLFAYEPQKYFITSEVRCARFYGNVVEKPIPSYKVFKGNVFYLVDQSVDFVLSKLDYSIGTRAENVSIPGTYEIPKEIIAEAIVNAVVHRDYTSNASVQIMVFSDRIEIWNPGLLPMGWTTEKLKQLHSSVPANPLLAEPMYLAGYIERMGTGTSDMIKYAKRANLKEPDFFQEDSFKTIIYRHLPATAEATGEVTAEATGEVTGEVKKIIKIMSFEMKRSEIQDLLGLKHDDYFRVNYILPALKLKVIEMTIPDKPNNPNQKYRLTKLGFKLKNQLNKDSS